MIIILSWPFLLFIVGVWVAFSVLGAVLYGTQNSWDDDRVKWLKTFTAKQKWGLFALLLTILGGAVAFGCGIVYHEPISGVFGFLGVLIASVVAAYICSPLKWDWEAAGVGCNPLGVIASLASLLLVVAFSWLFILLAIFRKATWRLYVGIVLAFGIILMGVAGGFVLYERQEIKGLYQTAENYIAQGDYETAMTLYQKLGDEARYLQTWYDYGMWCLEEGEELRAIQTLQELDNAYRYKDAGIQAKGIIYQRGLRQENEGNYGGAIYSFQEILDYEDARQHYKYCNYMYGMDRMENRLFEKATEYFREAGDYEDAAEYVIYSQVRQIANENLLQAEDLLRQLPRDFLDVDMLLTAIEDYGYLNGSYTITKATGDDPFSYKTAWVTLVYEQHLEDKTPTLEFEVTLVISKKGVDYGSEGILPQKGVLKFESGRMKFVVTEKTVKVEETRERVGTTIKGEDKNYYTFQRVNDNR